MLIHQNRRERRASVVHSDGLRRAERGYGRFMQADPLGYADGLNWYDYVGGDPINYYDPSGTDLKCNDGRYFTAEELKKFGDTAPCAGDVVALGGGGGHGGGFGGFGAFGGSTGSGAV